jgi:hypothetical protein
VKSWGPGPFDNDDAMEWVGEVLDGGDGGSVEFALHLAADAPADTRLESPEGAAALAAAEFVAAGLGHPSADAPPELRGWLAKHELGRRKGIRDLARRAVVRVKTGASELADLYAGSPDAAAWRASVDDLLALLGGTPS